MADGRLDLHERADERSDMLRVLGAGRDLLDDMRDVLLLDDHEFDS